MSDITDLSDYLFVYGTLRKGFKNRYARFLQSGSTYIGTGYVLGRLFEMGGYPAMLVGENEDEQVWGDIYKVENASKIFPMLDTYEEIGSIFPKPNEYRKELANVYLDGGVMMAIVYVYNREIEREPRIHSGDYMLYKEMV